MAKASSWMNCLAIVVVVAFVAYLLYGRSALQERYSEQCRVKQCVQRCTDEHGSGNWGEKALQGCLNQCGYVEQFYDSVSMPDPAVLRILNQGRPDYVPTPPIEAFVDKKKSSKVPVPKKKMLEGFEEEREQATVKESKKAEDKTKQKVNQYAGTYSSLMNLAQKKQQ